MKLVYVTEHVHILQCNDFILTDELKIPKIDETNPIEDYMDNDTTQTNTKLIKENQVQFGTNRKRRKSRGLVEQKQFECSDCSDVFTSSKM